LLVAKASDRLEIVLAGSRRKNSSICTDGG
jgi:septum formation topological specificity factor MinE